jgi:type I restriction enzyme S subunit
VIKQEQLIRCKKVKLGNIVSFKTGKLNSNAAKPNGAYPFFTCSQETFRTDTYSFDVECVLLGGNNANGIYPLKYFSGKFDAYQRTYIIRALDNKILSNRYLFFALQPKLELLKSISTGAATKFLTLTILNDIEFDLPPLPTQHKIAAILSAYDDLIENNTRRIKILEEMAQALYREWFVNFRFPGHEKVRMVESEIGMVPEGWEVKQIQDICSKINSGGTPARQNDTYWQNGDVDWFKTKELQDGFLFSSEEKISRAGLENSSAKIFSENTIVMAIYAAPTVGRLGILTHPSCFNQAAVGLVADPEVSSSRFLYYKLFEMRDYFNLISRGAALSHNPVMSKK